MGTKVLDLSIRTYAASVQSVMARASASESAASRHIEHANKKEKENI